MRKTLKRCAIGATALLIVVAACFGATNAVDNPKASANTQMIAALDSGQQCAIGVVNINSNPALVAGEQKNVTMTPNAGASAGIANGFSASPEDSAMAKATAGATPNVGAPLKMSINADAVTNGASNVGNVNQVTQASGSNIQSNVQNADGNKVQ